MLTDRQQKFYTEISRLANSVNLATEQERKYLGIAESKIASGKNFGETINSLNLALKALDFGNLQAGGLREETKILYKNLISAYGLPENNDIYAEHLADSVGREVINNEHLRETSAWYAERQDSGENPKGAGVTIANFFGVSLGFIIVGLFLYAGYTGFSTNQTYLMVLSVLGVILILLVFLGRSKRKKK